MKSFNLLLRNTNYKIKQEIISIESKTKKEISLGFLLKDTAATGGILANKTLALSPHNRRIAPESITYVEQFINKYKDRFGLNKEAPYVLDKSAFNKKYNMNYLTPEESAALIMEYLSDPKKFLVALNDSGGSSRQLAGFLLRHENFVQMQNNLLLLSGCCYSTDTYMTLLFHRARILSFVPFYMLAIADKIIAEKNTQIEDWAKTHDIPVVSPITYNATMDVLLGEAHAIAINLEPLNNLALNFNPQNVHFIGGKTSVIVQHHRFLYKLPKDVKYAFVVEDYKPQHDTSVGLDDFFTELFGHVPIENIACVIFGNQATPKKTEKANVDAAIREYYSQKYNIPVFYLGQDGRAFGHGFINLCLRYGPASITRDGDGRPYIFFGLGTKDITLETFSLDKPTLEINPRRVTAGLDTKFELAA
jgi:hypothetical protein